MKPYLTAKNILVALCAFLSLPALLWSLIMILAGGMKTVPSMSVDEVAMGVIPSLVLIMVYFVLTILRERLKLPIPLVVACLLASGVCSLAVALGFFAYYAQGR